VRGREVIDLLTAVNTGHDGGAATVHANSAADVPARIATLALAAGLDRRAACAYLLTGISAVVHVVRERTAEGAGRRRPVGIAILQPGPRPDTITVVPAVHFHPDGLDAGPGYEALREQVGHP